MTWGLPFPLFGDAAAAQPPIVTIADQTISNVAQLDVAWIEDFDLVRVLISNYAPAGNDTSLSVRFSSDGGTTFDSGNNYSMLNSNDVNGVAVTGSGSNGNRIQLNPNGTNWGMISTTAQAAMMVTITRPFDTGLKTTLNSFGGYFQNNGDEVTGQAFGQINVAGRTDALRFFQNSGNMLSGHLFAWGELPLR